MVFVDRTLELIAKNGITKNKLLTSLGLSKNSFVDWINRGTIPSADTVSKIAQYFKVSTDYLLGNTDDPDQKPGEENIAFTDFTYAMHNEEPYLDEADKQMLMDMARRLRARVKEKNALDNKEE